MHNHSQSLPVQLCAILFGYCLQVLVPTTGPSYTNPVQNNLLKAYWSHEWWFACFHCIWPG